jgi:thiopurine S-methyltransferase
MIRAIRTAARSRGIERTARGPVHPEFWHARWRSGQIGFHQPTVNRLLERHWPRVVAGLPPGAPVYVPLCGKSLDLAWLAERGHRVVGSELSGIALAEFLGGARPAISAAGPAHRAYDAGPYRLIEGDACTLQPEQTGPLAAVYDRAALVALPEGSMRADYAASLVRLLAPEAPGLLLSFEFPQDRRPGPPFSLPRAAVEAVLAADFEIEELERSDVIAENPKFAASGIEQLWEVAYRLRRR